MNIAESAFYALPYYVLATFLMNCQKTKKDSTVYNISHHQEAINVLLDRMERAQTSFDKDAFFRLIDAPVIVGDMGHRGFVQSIVNNLAASSFSVRIWIPDLAMEIDIHPSTPFSFDKERLPRLSVHAKQ